MSCWITVENCSDYSLLISDIPVFILFFILMFGAVFFCFVILGFQVGVSPLCSSLQSGTMVLCSSWNRYQPSFYRLLLPLLQLFWVSPYARPSLCCSVVLSSCFKICELLGIHRVFLMLSHCNDLMLYFSLLIVYFCLTGCRFIFCTETVVDLLPRLLM